MPGCYPTAARLALKPLIEKQLLNLDQWPVINATSGVSGAGRKASMTTSFCEVSLQPYGIFTHRHQPEIAAHWACRSSLRRTGNFPRGILETITCRLKAGVTAQDVAAAYHAAYDDKPLVRLYDEGRAGAESGGGAAVLRHRFCGAGRASDRRSGGRQPAEGAAAQAVQCLNIRFGFRKPSHSFKPA